MDGVFRDITIRGTVKEDPLTQFLAFCFERTAPQFAVRSETGRECVEIVALGKGERAVIGEALEAGFQPGTRLQRRAFGRAVKIYIEFYLELADILFEPRQLLVDLSSLFSSGIQTPIEFVAYHCHGFVCPLEGKEPGRHLFKENR